MPDPRAVRYIAHNSEHLSGSSQSAATLFVMENRLLLTSRSVSSPPRPASFRFFQQTTSMSPAFVGPWMSSQRLANLGTKNSNLFCVFSMSRNPGEWIAVSFSGTDFSFLAVDPPPTHPTSTNKKAIFFIFPPPFQGCAFYLFIRQPHGSEVSPAARNTLDSARIPRASKLLICGPFQKGRVLAQDGVAYRRASTASAGLREF